MISRPTLRHPRPRKPAASPSAPKKGDLSRSEAKWDGEKGLTPLPCLAPAPATGSSSLPPDSLRVPALEFSLTSQKLTAHSGILDLMDDLGRAMTIDPDMLMLGGGNPAAVPELQALCRERMRELLDPGEAFDRMLANYEPPQGNPRFLKALAELLQRTFGCNEVTVVLQNLQDRLEGD